jgi:hypothetical protein
MYFEDTIDENKYCGHLFGLGSSLFQNGLPYETYIAPQTLVAVAQSVAATAHAHVSQSQSSLPSLISSQANSNSQSMSNLPTNLSSTNLNGMNDSNIKKFYFSLFILSYYL